MRSHRGAAKPLLDGVSATFAQGMMYAIVGPPHQGKSTFLKVLGQVLLPDRGHAGYIFVPPHLRVLHMSNETFVMSSSLMKNIVFNTDLAKVGGTARVRRICEILHFPDYMLSELEAEIEAITHDIRHGHCVEVEGECEAAKCLNWISKLTHTDFAKLNLARAFVMNPEFLVLHKPTLAFHDADKLHLVELLRAHVNQKGLQLSAENRKLRRRRTVFFTCASMIGVNLADSIYDVSIKSGLRNVTAEVKSMQSGEPIVEEPLAELTTKCLSDL